MRTSMMAIVAPVGRFPGIDHVRVLRWQVRLARGSA